MGNRKAISTAAALALAAVLFVPGTPAARGARGFAGHGPVFGFHPQAGGHRPFRPALAQRAARFGWQLRWWKQRARDRAGAGAVYPAADGGVPYYPGDVTGGVPGPAVFVPPVLPSAPPERVGCFARGYDVPGETGGAAHVTVIRCPL